MPKRLFKPFSIQTQKIFTLGSNKKKIITLKVMLKLNNKFSYTCVSYFAQPLK